MEEYDNMDLLHEMFRSQAKRTPNKVALVTSTGDSMTYKELDEVTDILATRLIYDGVKPNNPVGIYIERCKEYVLAYIAILKAGGGYMPMELSYPQTLLDNVISDASPPIVFTEPSLKGNLPDHQAVFLFQEGWLEDVKRRNAQHVAPPEQPKLTLDNLAYLVYSSGSTGVPKGIICPHRGAVLACLWRLKHYPYVEGEREACNVFFIWEIIRPLMGGATLYVIPDSVIYDPKLLCDFLKKFKITRMQYSPSLLEAVLDAKDVDPADSMETMTLISFCGEVVTTGLIDRSLKMFPKMTFLNLYSLSETHDLASGNLTEWVNKNKETFRKRKYCSVGGVMPGVEIFIMDKELKPQPVGVAGEIYVGGPGLADGYLNRPALNAERFIQRPPSLPASKWNRIFRSGDWGYMLSDGSFEICGRCDSMVKIRGYSIEIRAVESALTSLPMVNICSVFAQGEEGEDKFLVAVVVPERNITKKMVRAALKKVLPFYMIPSYFIFMESLPLMPGSMKLDRKKLPALAEVIQSQEDIGASAATETESQLVPLFCEVLGLKSVDIQESFFDLGGHSLLAARLLSKVKATFGVEVSVKDLFLHPTVFAIGRLLDSRLGKANGNGSDGKEVVVMLDLQKEVEKHDQTQNVLGIDIQLRAFWRSMHNAAKWKTADVLLTGATGFLGAFILRDLLMQTKHDIYCLVREQPDTENLERIKQAFVKFNILPEDLPYTDEQTLIDSALTTRVHCLAGDVGLIHMGLNEVDYTYLCTEIDFIIHAAAYVNLVFPYQALHGPNVFGTQNVILFACNSKIKPLHYISTNSVFPHGEKDCREEADMSAYATQLTDGYSQSKWVAEQLVRRAMSRGLPGAIYRLGNLSGDQRNAGWNADDFNLLTLQSCLVTGSTPDLDWEVEMTPVDFVSQFVVRLTKEMSVGLGKTFNIINPDPIKAEWFFEWFRAKGYEILVENYDQWVRSVEGAVDSGKLGNRSLSLARDKSLFEYTSTFIEENTERVLQQFGWAYPKINNNLLDIYIRNLVKRKIIPKLKSNTTMSKTLEGKVMIVTGASSGIGVGIAKALASAGAHVVLAARREDKLKQIKDEIVAEDGKAMAVATDVTNKAQVQELVKKTVDVFGGVDVLVNNAGIMHYTFMKNLKDDEWNKEIDLNCKGTMNCIGAVLPGMMERKKGHIVNISSDAGRKGFAGLAVYSGTKFFIEGMSQALRAEMVEFGVKVTCVQPGDVESELLGHTSDKEAMDQYFGGKGMKILEPSDIGNAVVYAVSQPQHVAVNEILVEPKDAPL